MMSKYNDKHTQDGRGSLNLSTARGMKDGRYHLDRGNPRSSERGKSDPWIVEVYNWVRSRSRDHIGS